MKALAFRTVELQGSFIIIEYLEDTGEYATWPNTYPSHDAALDYLVSIADELYDENNTIAA